MRRLFLLRTPRAETGFIVDLHCRVVAPVACTAVQIRSIMAMIEGMEHVKLYINYNIFRYSQYLMRL